MTSLVVEMQLALFCLDFFKSAVYKDKLKMMCSLKMRYHDTSRRHFANARTSRSVDADFKSRILWLYVIVRLHLLTAKAVIFPITRTEIVG